MRRRTFLTALAGVALLPRFAPSAGGTASSAATAVGRPARWVRPGAPGWPGPGQWAALGDRVGGRLVKVRPAFGVCAPDPGAAACTSLFQNLTDSFYLDQSVNLTQTLGWLDAFTAEPSAYAVLASSSADVAAAVNFARGDHYARLLRAKERYDPDGLFTVHHGVGTDA